MKLQPAEIVRSVQVWVCDSCGCQDRKSCGCDATAHAEELAAKREAHRQSNRAAMQRKRQQNQGAVDNTRAIENIVEFPRKQLAEIMPTEEEAQKSYQETLYAQALVLLEEMAPETRRRFFVCIKEVYGNDNR